MATFKRLRLASEGTEIDVNMDTVLHMQRYENHTTLHFAVMSSEKVLTLSVRETPDQIHLASPLPRAR
jgi:hypothetical protein